MSRRPRGAGRLGLALALALVAGCGSTPPLGPVSPPEIYPDRTEPELAFWTFLWAWHRGDVPVLRSSLGAWLRKDLEERIAKEPEAAVSEWYRRGAEDLRLRELEWTQQGDALAYLRVVLSSAAVERAELDFAMLRRPDGWVVSGKRLLR